MSHPFLPFGGSSYDDGFCAQRSFCIILNEFFTQKILNSQLIPKKRVLWRMLFEKVVPLQRSYWACFILTEENTPSL